MMLSVQCSEGAIIGSLEMILSFYFANIFRFDFTDTTSYRATRLGDIPSFNSGLEIR